MVYPTADHRPLKTATVCLRQIADWLKGKQVSLIALQEVDRWPRDGKMFAFTRCVEMRDVILITNAH